MGHLVNPTSLRLSINSYWNSTWALSNNFNYINLYKQDYLLFSFLNWFIEKIDFIKADFIISYFKIYRVHSQIFINFYYYDTKEAEINCYVFRNLFNSALKLNKVYKKVWKFEYTIKDLYEYVFKNLITYIYWYILQYTIRPQLAKLSLKSEYFFNIYSMNISSISAETITKYIGIKLQHKNSLNWILRPILKDLNVRIKTKNILGYKILCSGRFTRKQIATREWKKLGPIKFNYFTNLTKYSQTHVRLKYGACGVKLWINYGANDVNLYQRKIDLFYPIYNVFKYNYIKVKTCLNIYINHWFYIYLKITQLKAETYGVYKHFLYYKIKVLLYKFFNYKDKKNLLSKYTISKKTNNIITVTYTPILLNNKNKKKLIYE